MDTGTMAISKTPKLNLPLYSSGNDPHPGRVDHNDIMSAIEANAAGGAQGTHATRPGAGVAKRLYFSTDRKTLAWDNGSTWVDLVPIGGQAPKGVDVAGAVGTDPLLQGAGGSEGSSDRVARADHVHYIPLATSATAGLMTSAQAGLLDGATSSSTANRVAQRDASGRLQVASPAAGSDAATKAYVDTQASNASNLSTGTVPVARLPLASGTAAGAMSAADKAMLDAATTSNNPSTLVRRSTAGRFDAGSIALLNAPASASDATRKDYVDAQVATRAESGHKHAGEDITSGTVAAARLPLASTTEPGAMSPSDKELLDNSTSGSEPNTLMKRNAAGETIAAGFYLPASTPQPNLGQAMTRKDYVDAQIATRAAASHNHSAANITSGTLAAARLPLASDTANGAMSAADKAKLDAATASPTANTLVMNDAAGRFQTATPAAVADVANKGYVDGKQWSGASITSGVISPDRIANATSSLDGLMPKTDKERLDGAAVTAIPGSIAMRNGNGQIQVADPGSAPDAANRRYVDGKTWAGSAITSGTISPDRIANATSSLDGLMPKTDKAKLDAATVFATGDTIPLRNAAGNIEVGDATNAKQAANRGYVDSLVNGLLVASPIPGGVNLNTFTSSGVFHQNQTAAADPALNYPAKIAGRLDVTVNDTGAFVYQRYTTYGNEGRVYERARYAGTWYPWTTSVYTVKPRVLGGWDTAKFSVYAPGQEPTLRVQGGMVHVSGAMMSKVDGVGAGIDGADGPKICLIPPEFRTIETVNIWVCQGSGKDTWCLSLESSGYLHANRYGPGTPKAGTWFPFNVSWPIKEG